MSDMRHIPTGRIKAITQSDYVVEVHDNWQDTPRVFNLLIPVDMVPEGAFKVGDQVSFQWVWLNQRIDSGMDGSKQKVVK